MFWLVDDNKYMPCEDVWVIKGILGGFINVRKAKKATSFMHTKISRHYLSPKHTYINTFSSTGTIKWNRHCWEAIEMIHEIRYAYSFSFAICNIGISLGNSLENIFHFRNIVYFYFMSVGVQPACRSMLNILGVDLQSWASMWVLGIEPGSCGSTLKWCS